MKRDDGGKFASETSLSEDNKEIIKGYAKSLQQIKPNTKQSTIDRRTTEIRYWLEFCETHDINPLEADKEEVQAYIQSITDKANTTILSYFASVSSFYSIATVDKLNDKFNDIYQNPCSDINLRRDYDIYSTSEYKRRQAKNTDESITTIPVQDIEKAISEATGTGQTRIRNQIIIRLLFYTAVRTDELVRIKTENINWDDCTINVRSSKIKQEENPNIYRRDVIFPEKFKYQLRRWVENIRPSYSKYSDQSPYLFLTSQSEQISKNTINQIVKESAEKADVQQPLNPPNPASKSDVKEWLFTPHRIRRTAISYWVNKCESIDLHHARKIAGHAQIQRTMSYVDTDDDELREAYQKDMSDI